MRSTKALPLLMLMLQTCGNAALAQAPLSQEAELALSYGDRSVISVATGNRQPLRRAPAVATVITAEDMAAMGADSLDEVLEAVPGLHVGRIAVVGRPQYAMRGILSTGSINPQILLLQDGLPITTAYTGDPGTMWPGMPLDNIARIEVVRGPGSALYGADAYAGVVNIVSKTAAQLGGTQLGLRGGSFGTRHAWLTHGGSWAGWDVALYLRGGSTEGHQRVVEADAQTRFDTLFGTRASLAPGPPALGYDSADARLEISRGAWKLQTDYRRRWHIGSGYGISSALDRDGQADMERAATTLAWTDDHALPDWSLGVQASVVNVRETMRAVLFPAGARFPTGSFPSGVLGGPERWERQWRVSANALYSGLPGQQWRFGAGHEDLDLYRTRTFKNFIQN